MTADVIAADGRFNIWFYKGKGILSQDTLLDVLGAYEDAVDKCRAAIDCFDGTADRHVLESALADTLRGLRSCFGHQAASTLAAT